MTAFVIGFEGSVPPDAVIAWGTAAIALDKTLFNPATGRSTPNLDVDRLAAEGHLTLLEKRIRLPDPIPAFDRSVVYAIRRESSLKHLLWAGAHKVAGRTNGSTGIFFSYNFFETFGQFDLFRRQLVKYLSWQVMFQCTNELDRHSLIEAGLTLCAKDPVMHALRVHFSPDESREIYQDIAETVIGNEEHCDVFRELLSACQNAETTYTIKYKKGIAEKGGLDIPDAGVILAAIRTAQERMRPEIVARRPYLGFERELPYHRLSLFQDQSATLGFTADVREATLGERVARHFELRALEAAVGGNTPAALETDAEFQQSMQIILSPSPETEVYHTPIGSAEQRVHFGAPNPTAIVRTEHIRTFAVLDGFLGSKIEFALHPPQGHSAGRVTMSSTDNGDGDLPVGSAQLERDFLYRPCIVSLRRDVEATGKERYHLQELQFVVAGPGLTATHFPSSTASGAFVAEEYTVGITDGILQFGFGQIHGILEHGKSRVIAWMMAFNSACLERELLAAKEVPRIPVPKDPRLTSTMKLAITLAELGGVAGLSDLSYQTAIRLGGEVVANARHLIERTPEYFAADDTLRSASLTPRGMRYAEALRLARGRRGAGVVPLPY
ncbi:MAG: hypothetical protein Q8P18_21395 [Pseudomonadota bacterium]|nr:hypothetical protein [Pseudomonadota bacterium]